MLNDRLGSEVSDQSSAQERPITGLSRPTESGRSTSGLPKSYHSEGKSVNPNISFY